MTLRSATDVSNISDPKLRKRQVLFKKKKKKKKEKKERDKNKRNKNLKKYYAHLFHSITRYKKGRRRTEKWGGVVAVEYCREEDCGNISKIPGTMVVAASLGLRRKQKERKKKIKEKKNKKKKNEFSARHAAACLVCMYNKNKMQIVFIFLFFLWWFAYFYVI
ncbi:hypothetical protein PUN28_011069 [Cardiocondyla obscurior]|uniref:Uncharacterized protein n=1 Tax=Cardiocondyla obscurior TaxID=286306 RepID=A0AAW2FJF5_9HYME